MRANGYAQAQEGDNTDPHHEGSASVHVCCRSSGLYRVPGVDGCPRVLETMCLCCRAAAHDVAPHRGLWCSASTDATPSSMAVVATPPSHDTAPDGVSLWSY